MKYLLLIICVIVCGGCSPSNKGKNIPVSDGTEKMLCTTAFLQMLILWQKMRIGKCI